MRPSQQRKHLFGRATQNNASRHKTMDDEEKNSNEIHIIYFKKVVGSEERKKERTAKERDFSCDTS